MNVYLAARYGRRLQMLGIAQQLESRGHRVTSRWIRGEHDSLDGDASPAQQAAWAEENIEDINSADVLLTITEEPGTDGAGRGGRHVELGVALGMDMPVLLVGPAEHVFHHARGVTQCLSIAHALDMLDTLETIERQEAATPDFGGAAMDPAQ